MIKLICVGKIKEKYYNQAIDEYIKRISKYTKLDIIEIPDEKIDNNLSSIKEGEKILSKISDKDYCIILDILGNSFNSLELAKKIDNLRAINQNIVFIIGGSHGLSDCVKKRSNESISFSSLTFPHQLFRVIFLEQLYRIFKILNNEPYHK